MTEAAIKREIRTETEKGLRTADLVLAAVLIAAVIGLITGAVSQIPLLCGTPFVNFASEMVGGAVIGTLAAIPHKAGRFDLVPTVRTFIAMFISGSLFSIIVVAIKSMDAMAGLVQFGPIVVITALCNAVLVGLLIIPLRKALRRS